MCYNVRIGTNSVIFYMFKECSEGIFYLFWINYKAVLSTSRMKG
jgi:hypothetical protein